MENFTKTPLPVSPIVQKSLQDSNGSVRSSVSSRSAYLPRLSDIRDSRGSVPVDPAAVVSDLINDEAIENDPQVPDAAYLQNSTRDLTRDLSSSSVGHQQQSHYVLPQSQSYDEIRSAIPSLPPSIQGFPFQKPWLGRQTSLGNVSTSSSFSTRRPLPEPLDRTPEALKSGVRSIWLTKWVFICAMISANGFFIFATWWWPKYYYILLPLITITVALNVVMVFSITFHLLFRLAVPEAQEFPAEPESMVLLLPCYNETREELVKSLDSLVGQTGIDENKKVIMIICDGNARGPGMAKTTGEYLLEDILTFPNTREYIPAAYTSWDHTEMDVVVQTGSYGGIPYMCIVKETNRGKRDSLILIRSFLYNFNIRETRPAVIQSEYFFGIKVQFLREANISNVDLLIGMDADTFFEPSCVSELIKQSYYSDTVGVCGYVAVDFGSNNWSPWRLYQNAEYTISQCLRRLHQSIATHKVSCLPGCCQLLKVCETTCGDRILLELFGYHPTATDHLLKQIRATASEDRNHVCLMLSAFPKARTRQALKARAFTDVPHSWSVFLSQRRRWSLGASSNDLFLIFAPGILLFERILALANVITWVLNFFIIACIASFIKACTFVHYSLILAFVSVMLVPIMYYIIIAVWHPRGVRERFQYLAGLSMYIFLGPFLNIIVLLFALRGIDNFAWGKTRKVVETVEVGAEEAAVNEKSAPEPTKPQRTLLFSD